MEPSPAPNSSNMTGPIKHALAHARRRCGAAARASRCSQSRTPLHRQIYDGVRAGILAGRLAANMRLPSTRVLASELGVARNTVVLAFDQLVAEGYLSARRGGGTRVRAAMPDSLDQRARARRPRARFARSPAPNASDPIAHPRAMGAHHGARSRARRAPRWRDRALRARHARTSMLFRRSSGRASPRGDGAAARCTSATRRRRATMRCATRSPRT